MPPRVFALILIAVFLAAGATVLAAQVLSLPWAILSILAVSAAAALRARKWS